MRNDSPKTGCCVGDSNCTGSSRDDCRRNHVGNQAMVGSRGSSLEMKTLVALGGNRETKLQSPDEIKPSTSFVAVLASIMPYCPICVVKMIGESIYIFGGFKGSRNDDDTTIAVDCRGGEIYSIHVIYKYKNDLDCELSYADLFRESNAESWAPITMETAANFSGNSRTYKTECRENSANNVSTQICKLHINDVCAIGIKRSSMLIDNKYN